MLCLAVSLLVLSASWSIGSSTECLQENANQFTDQLLTKFTDKMEETFPLPDNKVDSIRLRDGKVWGMNSLFRSGNAIMNCEKSDEGILILTVPINSSRPVRARYQWEHDILGRTMKGVAYIRANIFQATAKLRKVSSGQEPSKVLDLQVTHLDGVEVDVSGLAHVGWLLSKASTSIAKIFKSSFNDYVEDHVAHVMNHILLEMAER